ncbi:antitermination protein [Salmonella enterica]|nr:antitermination protein [Salmonella enterica]EKJ5694710.1 hypothetical protein [Salmonella enterica]
MVIYGCEKNNEDQHDLLVDHYVLGDTFIALVRQHSCSDGTIGKRLQGAEGVVEGKLMTLDVKLEMDRYVQRENSL